MSDEESHHSSDSIEDTRPNRWTGAAPTWLSLTEQERGLAASLDLIRNRDLSLHLYSAYGLKKGARKSGQSRKKEARASRENKIGNAAAVDEPEEDEGRDWAPPKSWTAWPLPSHLVPRMREQIGPDDPDEVHTLKTRDVPRPSRDLEDVLMGVTLKIAKENFEKRKWTDSDEEIASVGGSTESEEQAEGEVDPQDQERPIKESSQPRPRRMPQIPVVSADDGRSRELLRPSTRDTLSRLDDVLMALHLARKTCHQSGYRSDGTTDNESQPGSTNRNSYPGRKRPVGRPRKFSNLTSRPKEPQTAPPPKARSRGRPRKVYPRLDGETDEEHVIRVARIQKKPLPSFAPPSKSSSPKSPSSPESNQRSASRPRRKISTPEQLLISRQKKLGLRDWSEVIGAAAFVGISPDVIARATQRCSELFEQGMTIRTMTEAPFSAKDAEYETHYQPGAIPTFLSSSEESGSGEDESPNVEVGIYQSRAPLGAGAYTCPVVGCPRYDQGFEYELNLKRHLRKGHKMTKVDISGVLGNDSDEEMDGAVHVDGFLKPILPRRRAKKTPRKGKDREVSDSGKETTNSESDTD